MATLTRQTVLAEALALLDEVGLDALSTRRLARRLGMEQPSLYWHFRTKADLLTAMAEAAMAPLAAPALPVAPQDWREWFTENTRIFRRALLAHRDGARLHAGTAPETESLERAIAKVAFLTASGVPQDQALMAMLAASRFTLGSVLEEQADKHGGDGHRDRGSDGNGDGGADLPPGVPPIDHQMAFEAGLALITDGLAQRQRRDRHSHDR